MLSCPNCGQTGVELEKVDSGMRLGLQQAGQTGIPTAVCKKCYAEFLKVVSEGAKLWAEHKAKEQKRLNLWRSRVALVKQARMMMSHGRFSEAIVAYEKYLRILEFIYDTKPGELTPEKLQNSARAKEITVISTTYWDLLRMYDTTPKYQDRQIMVARKLSEFARLTPIFLDIIKKAHAYIPKARNKEAIKEFLKLSDADHTRCFIATAAFENYKAPEIQILLAFRDQVLSHSWVGKLFITCYYKLSPRVAFLMDNIPWTKPPTRFILRQIIWVLTRVRSRWDE